MVSDLKRHRVFFCLSTDTKPIEGVGNGDVLIEMEMSTDTEPIEGVGKGDVLIEMETDRTSRQQNTIKLYFFDADGAEWLEVGGS